MTCHHDFKIKNCDRCGRRIKLAPKADLPEGWGTVMLCRNGVEEYVTLCEVCTEGVMEALMPVPLRAPSTQALEEAYAQEEAAEQASEDAEDFLNQRRAESEDRLKRGEGA